MKQPRCDWKEHGMVRVRPTGGSLNRTIRCANVGTVRMVPNPKSSHPGQGDRLLCESCATRIESRGVWGWMRAETLRPAADPDTREAAQAA